MIDDVGRDAPATAHPELVALIGLGLMGSAIAVALSENGIRVRGFDVSEDRRRDHAARGSEAFATAREAVAGTRMILLSLPTSDDVRDVCVGPEGIAAELAPGSLIIDTTTARPTDSIGTARRLSEMGIGFVDASISGSSHMVANHDIVIMVGGTDEDVRAGEPILRALARSVHHMGPVGSGATTKLIANLVLGVHRLALAEGLVLGERSGMLAGPLLDVLRDGAAYSRAMDIWGPRMVAASYDPPTSRIRQHHKDVRLMLEQGDRSGTRLELTRVLERMLEEAEAHDLAEADLASLIEVVRRTSAGAADP